MITAENLAPVLVKLVRDNAGDLYLERAVKSQLDCLAAEIWLTASRICERRAESHTVPEMGTACRGCAHDLTEQAKALGRLK